MCNATVQELAAFAAPPGVSSQQLSALRWAPACGRPYELLAAAYGSCVVLYQVTQGSQASAPAAADQGAASVPVLRVTALQQLRHPAAVFQLEFNSLGTSLAASLAGSPEVWLWMPALSGEWEATTRLAGSGAGDHASRAPPSGGGAPLTTGPTDVEVD
jgi:hypothetical protein